MLSKSSKVNPPEYSKQSRINQKIKIMKKIDISKFNPDSMFLEYYNSKATFEEVWNECQLYPHMLWIAKKLGVDNRLLEKVKTECSLLHRNLQAEGYFKTASGVQFAFMKLDKEMVAICHDYLTKSVLEIAEKLNEK
jgi:hypothetical protein